MTTGALKGVQTKDSAVSAPIITIAPARSAADLPPVEAGKPIATNTKAVADEKTGIGTPIGDPTPAIAASPTAAPAGAATTAVPPGAPAYVPKSTTFTPGPPMLDAIKIANAIDIKFLASVQEKDENPGRFTEGNGGWSLVSSEHYAFLQEFTTLSLELGQPETMNGQLVSHARTTADLVRLKGTWANSVIGTQLAAKAPGGTFYVDMWYVKGEKFTRVVVSSTPDRSGDVLEIVY